MSGMSGSRKPPSSDIVMLKGSTNIGKGGNSSFHMASVPLAVTYVLFPVVQIGTRLAGHEVDRNWIDIAWAGLLLLSLIVLLIKNARHRVYMRFGTLALLLVIFAISGLLVFGIPLLGDVTLIPYLMELKMPFFVIFAGCWLKAFGSPGPKSFVTLGRALSIIILVDVVIESILSGHWVAPQISGEKNYDAALLVVSAVMALTEYGHNPGQKSGRTLLLLTGILASSSRTALIALGAIFLLSAQRRSVKFFAIFLAVAFALISFIIRKLDFHLVDMDRYWMWTTFLQLISDHPGVLLSGYGVGVPLSVDIPPQLAWLWQHQEKGWGISGVFAYNFHAFWIRIVLTWGGLGLALMAYFASKAVSKRVSFALRALSVVVLIEGMTMGLFYLSNVSVPLLLGIYIAVGMRREVTHTSVAQAGQG